MPIDLVSRVRERLSRERGTIYPKHAGLRIALAFPNTYGLGMASLGFQLVYRMLNGLPNVSCERVFLPAPEELAEHERTGAGLFSLETQTPLRRFDAVAFSVSFELDYINVLRILRLGRIPFERALRNESHPVVIAGGICPTFNPEPLADFVDAFVIGDAEPVLPGLVAALEWGIGGPRRSLLESLSSLPGVYVPEFPRRVERAVAADLSGFPCISAVSTPDAEFGDVVLVEVARGCGRRCRFCVAGHANRPFRPRLLDDVEPGRRYGLVGAAVFDCPDAPGLCRRILDKGGEFTVSSVRLETVTAETAGLLAQGGQKTLTIAPEAATDRLRAVINKAADESRIAAAVSNARDAGIRRVKLYFMVGLPTETGEDAREIARLALRLSKAFPEVSFQISVACFVPKPWTPFQWSAMEKEQVLRRRISMIKKMLPGRSGVEAAFESPRLAMVQGLLARGDRAAGRILALALENGGDYRAAIRESGVDAGSYLYRERDKCEHFPWNHIRVVDRKDALWREYERSLRGQ